MMVYSSKVMVCGLDHSGSQPFVYTYCCTHIFYFNPLPLGGFYFNPCPSEDFILTLWPLRGGRYRSDRDRFLPPPRLSHHPQHEYSGREEGGGGGGGYTQKAHDGGYLSYEGGGREGDRGRRGGTRGRGGGRRNWRYPAGGARGGQLYVDPLIRTP